MKRSVIIVESSLSLCCIVTPGWEDLEIAACNEDQDMDMLNTKEWILLLQMTRKMG